MNKSQTPRNRENNKVEKAMKTPITPVKLRKRSTSICSPREVRMKARKKSFRKDHPHKSKNSLTRRKLNKSMSETNFMRKARKMDLNKSFSMFPTNHIKRLLELPINEVEISRVPTQYQYIFERKLKKFQKKKQKEQRVNNMKKAKQKANALSIYQGHYGFAKREKGKSIYTRVKKRIGRYIRSEIERSKLKKEDDAGRVIYDWYFKTLPVFRKYNMYKNGKITKEEYLKFLEELRVKQEEERKRKSELERIMKLRDEERFKKLKEKKEVIEEIPPKRAMRRRSVSIKIRKKKRKRLRRKKSKKNVTAKDNPSTPINNLSRVRENSFICEDVDDDELGNGRIVENVNFLLSPIVSGKNKQIETDFGMEEIEEIVKLGESFGEKSEIVDVDYQNQSVNFSDIIVFEDFGPRKEKEISKESERRDLIDSFSLFKELNDKGELSIKEKVKLMSKIVNQGNLDSPEEKVSPKLSRIEIKMDESLNLTEDVKFIPPENFNDEQGKADMKMMSPIGFVKLVDESLSDIKDLEEVFNDSPVIEKDLPPKINMEEYIIEKEEEKGENRVEGLEKSEEIEVKTDIVTKEFPVEDFQNSKEKEIDDSLILSEDVKFIQLEVDNETVGKEFTMSPIGVIKTIDESNLSDIEDLKESLKCQSESPIVESPMDFEEEIVHFKLEEAKESEFLESDSLFCEDELISAGHRLVSGEIDEVYDELDDTIDLDDNIVIIGEGIVDDEGNISFELEELVTPMKKGGKYKKLSKKKRKRIVKKRIRGKQCCGSQCKIL